MTRTSAGAALTVLLSAAALGQTAAAPPAFDLADVHPSARVTNPYMRGGVLRGGRYDVRTASLLDLIVAAYGLDSDKIQGGPSWLDTDRFDIAAKAPASTPPETVKLMLQTLLADRFALKVHKDTKPLPAYALSLGKGKHKLKASDGSASSNCQGQPQPPPQPGSPRYNVVACRNQTLDQLAQDLHDMAGAYLPSPVVNQTGLQGAWDFDLKWSPRGQLAAAGDAGISLFDAVDKQLGLKLEPQKLPIAVLVVDSVNQKPTPNAPGVTSNLPPPPPAEFEVATVKPSEVGATGERGRLEHGRLDAENLSLKTLVMVAWDLNADELLANAPKFLDSARYNITAKAPPPAAGTETDMEDLRLMVRALLADRFHLKAHLETRPVEGYVLTAVKPKLQKADPSNRTACHEGPGLDGKDPRNTNPVLNRLITCQNMTMAQFVAQLPNVANGYAHVDVVDETGLTDPYDFTLSFSGINFLRGTIKVAQPASATGDGGASDPSGAISLPEAISRQLGLKMEMKKRPMQVLVIDHIDEKPTDN